MMAGRIDVRQTWYRHPLASQGLEVLQDVQRQDFQPADVVGGDHFGYTVDVDGDRAVVGAPFAENGGNNQGSAYVYHHFNGTEWVETQKLTSSDAESFDEFGISVAISGTTIVVGAEGEATNEGR